MFTEKPSLFIEFSKNGDIRILIDLIKRYEYTDDEVSKVINFYVPDENGKIPEVEHIEVLLSYFPKSKITEETIYAIKKSFPNRLQYIINQNKK